MHACMHAQCTSLRCLQAKVVTVTELAVLELLVKGVSTVSLVQLTSEAYHNIGLTYIGIYRQ